MTEKRKDYLSPRMTVVKVQPVQIICGSKDGTFGLSNDGQVEKGSDEDWSSTDLAW